MQQFKQYHFFSLLLVLLVSGCATTNQAPFPKQQYQDLTSRFNAYFNAKEKEKAVLQTVEKAHKDNYDEVISVFYYTNPKEFASSTGDLEDIEKRCTRSLQIHTVANYVDDHFLLIGKANYFKGDYEKALTNFKFVTTEYKEGVDYVKEMKRLKGKTVKASKKKKPAKKAKFEKVLDAKGNLVLNKVDERPSYSLFVHEPARAEALLWLAKTYTAQEKYTEALSVIQYAKSDDKFYKNLDKELLLTEANIFIQKKDYAQAIAPLEKFLTMTKKKKQRLRPLLALAQIHEKLGNHAQSAGYYKIALKSNPGYDMEFYAKMQQTRLSRKGKVNIEEVKKILVKMSHDGKYKEYLDQIYYELGEITLGENNRSVAREWYHKSIDNSTSNTVQKSQSFLRLAQMDYDEEVYRASKFYYDSTIIGMSAKDTLYETTVKRGKVLGRLVENLDVIAEQDSLQRVAKMSDAERSRFIKKLIAQKEKELAKKEREKNQPVQNNNNLPSSNVPSASIGSDDAEAAWYFYNPLLRGNGYNEFVRKWGKRKFEDNWRRKDKTSSSSDNTADSDTLKQQQDDKDAATTDESKYLAGLPMTEEKITQSNDKLIDAYYNAGVIYKDDLNSNRKANQMFDEMVRKFPKGKLNLEAYYQIYLIAVKTKNQARADEYKAKIITEYPDSKIAKYIQDPGYLDKLKESENAVANYYQSTYEDYAKGLYVEAIEKCKLADVKFKPNTYKPKFDLLNAMVEAKQNRLDDYIQSLNKIIAKYNGTQEQEMAKKLLADLNKSKLPMLDLSKQVIDTTKVDSIPAKAFEPIVPSAVDNSDIKATLDANKAKIGQALAKFVSDSLQKTKKEVKPEYKPLSKSERLDSIMKAQKNPKPTVSSTPTPTETPAPVTKADTVKSVYKPLSKSERLDSIMKAAKKAPTKSSAPQSSPSVAKTDTAKGKQVVASKDTLKKTTITKVDSTKNKSTVKVQPKPVVKADTVASKPVSAVKDTVKKATSTKVDSSKAKTLAKPIAKTDTVKPKPVSTKVDSAKQKASAKPTAVVPKTDTVKSSQPTVAVNVVVVDSNDKEPIYGLSDAAPHQIVIYFKNGDQFSSTLVAKLETFEQSKLAGISLTNRSVILDSKNKLILMKSFSNKTDALSAAKTLQTGIVEAIGVSSEDVYVFAISTLNYTTLISTKRLGNYLNFYKENYK